MHYRQFGRTKLQISEVSLGGAYLMGPHPAQAEDNVHQVVKSAFALGINYIDTAPLYGMSENLLGQALADIADQFHFATKVGLEPEDFDYNADSVLWSLDRSLKRLQISKLTVAQIHEVNVAGWDRIMSPGGALSGLRQAQQKGMCDFIGITARAIPLLAELADTGEFDTVLVYHDYHPARLIATETVIPTAVKQQMGIVVATVLAGGLYTDQHQQVLAKISNPVERQRVTQILQKLQANEHTLPQNAFRFVLADERVTTVSSGAANVPQLTEVVKASTLGTPTL
jgi:L-galactose dehydrogenase|tara:strand:- start:56 stop:910 length:855 start_codon:yes stop_codon:yes gene_type:complete